MTNADKFKAVFGMYSEEFWAKPEQDMLSWINSEYQKPQTNADRIRNMTDEELAKWFCSMCNFGDFCPYQDDCDTNGSGILKWMKEEVKDV